MAPQDGRPRALRRRGRGEDAVSPVIGTILVLAISVMGIVGVSNWGLPAIQQLQSTTQERQVLQQFLSLDAELQQLAAGTAGQTTFKWQPALPSGAVDVNDSADRWLVSSDLTSQAFFWSGLNDGDASFTLLSPSGVASFSPHAWQWSGGAKTELLVGSDTTTSCTRASVLTGGASTILTLKVNNSAAPCPLVNISGSVLSFEFDTNTTPLAIAYLADVGHVHWQSSQGFAVRHLLDTNGAILRGPADALVTQSMLGTPPPRDFTNSSNGQATSLFFRFMKLNGTASFSAVQGAVQRSVFLNLVGAYTMGSTDPIQTAYVYVWGPTQNATYAALSSSSDGYRLTQQTNVTLGETFLSETEAGRDFSITVVYNLVGVQS